jgi:hypothetical protein
MHDLLFSSLPFSLFFYFTSLVGHGNEQDGLSNTRVGELILVINRPRKQKKNKINVCSILVNRKKNYNPNSND